MTPFVSLEIPTERNQKLDREKSLPLNQMSMKFGEDQSKAALVPSLLVMMVVPKCDEF